jgi:hypothetical protein
LHRAVIETQVINTRKHVEIVSLGNHVDDVFPHKNARGSSVAMHAQRTAKLALVALGVTVELAAEFRPPFGRRAPTLRLVGVFPICLARRALATQ